MIIENLEQLQARIDYLQKRTPEPLPKRVLMADPKFFDVAYAINPFMKDASGALQKVDKNKAIEQWNRLREKYQELGFEVSVIEAVEGFQDLVFAANQSLPFWDPSTNSPSVLMSQMRSEFRKGEVKFFEDWYRKNGHKVYHCHDSSVCFEGNGDILLHPGRAIIWGGCGPRTDKKVFAELTSLIGRDIIVLPLIHPSFYHLDTCFSILNDETVVVQPGAFSSETMTIIKKVFKHVIETTIEDCSQFFTGNCHCPNGKDVIFHQGSREFEVKLQKAGFMIHSLDTSEFMKSGGSVFCMKMMCF